MRSRISAYAAAVVLVSVFMLAACLPTPEIAPVQNKSGSLVSSISGNYKYEPEDAAALNGQTWSEQVYQTEEISVTVDAQILTQNVKGYPAVRVKDDTEKYLASPYYKKMIDYFFEACQPYYRTIEPTKRECEIKTLWFQEALSSGHITADVADKQLEYYKNKYKAASEEVPFDIEVDPLGEKYMNKTGMDRIGLISYPVKGLAFLDISKDHLAFFQQTSLYNLYDYEVGLSSLSEVPKSVDMDTDRALKVAEDSVNAIAAGNDMELVRTAAINKISTYISDPNDYQHVEPECLVFYFMRSYGGVKSTYITPSDYQFNLNEADPQYRPGVQPEYIRVVIDDLSIAGWEWVNPSMTTDIISDNVPLMPFEQIKDIFRQQVKNRYTYLDVHEIHNFRINKIVLGLMKIDEKDNIGADLVIPVWDFIGIQEIVYDGIKDGGNADFTYLTVNAIDGSIIDRGFGY